jgi:ankyrin repeat protein
LLAFVQAVSANDTNTVGDLIARGVDVNQRFGPLNETVLFRAAMWGHLEVANQLIAAGADPLATDKWGSTPFQIAASRGHRKVAEALIARGAKFDAKNARGRTALFMAAKEGSEETALWLLDLGADPDVQIKDSSETVMFHAAFNGNSKLVSALVKRGARTDGKDQEGWTPLHAATLRGDVGSVKALLNAGAKVNVLDDHGLTPLLLGIHQGYGDQAAIVDLLVTAGADLSKTDKYGRSALDLARERKEESAEADSDELARLDAILSRLKYYQKHPPKKKEAAPQK